MSHVRYDASCMEKSIKFSQSLMFWGCMSAIGIEKICFLERLINVAVFQDVLDLFPYTTRRGQIWGQ